MLVTVLPFATLNFIWYENNTTSDVFVRRYANSRCHFVLVRVVLFSFVLPLCDFSITHNNGVTQSQRCNPIRLLYPINY